MKYFVADVVVFLRFLYVIACENMNLTSSGGCCMLKMQIVRLFYAKSDNKCKKCSIFVVEKIRIYYLNPEKIVRDTKPNK